MLITFESNDISKCQEKINNHLNRCLTSSKISSLDGIFNSWDQYTLNAFYKYCKDRYVLPQIDKTGNTLELTGPVNYVREAKKKWYFLRELVKEKTSNTSKIEPQDSARLDNKSTTNTTSKKVYNVMISYSERDERLCQRLIDRLVEEEFSVWAEPIRVGQLRDVSSQIDKADFIILCVSENSYESSSCEKETKYAFKTGKPVFSVKIQNDPLIGWQREIFEKKLFTQLFGSDNHFDMEFSHLLLQIVSAM